MSRPRVVIVGGGFAGYQAARTLSRLARDAAEIVLVNPTDYFLYLPLLPEVASGVLEPRRVTVSLPDTLPNVRVVLGEVDQLALPDRRVGYRDPEGQRGELDYDRLVISVGSVNKLLPIPGATEHAHGFRGLPEALYLRDHIIRQIELADHTDDPAERAARCTFVVVGAGYTGTEVAAHCVTTTDMLIHRHPRLAGQQSHWLLLDVADRVLPELGERMSRAAQQVLDSRRVEVRRGTSVTEATGDGVRLSDGEFIPTRSLIWCVGVRPDPVVDALDLPTRKGRLVVDEYLTVPGHPEVFACGDAAAVPDPSRSGEITAMTAQHAVRQGKLAAYNVAASYGHGSFRPYRHREIGFTVDLGGAQAAADLFHVMLSGPVAKAVTRGYHLASIPGNRVRVAADWTLEALLSRQGVQLGLVPPSAVPLDTASPELFHTLTR